MAEVVLDPSPGFCLKTTTVQPASVSLGPIPANYKLFVNIAWSDKVPPPPHGQDYVPLVLSDPRQDNDKAGKPSLVFDCIYNATLRSRCLRDSSFKTLIQELALQRIEAQTGLVLSRQISTPNIASKGKLLPRKVVIPALPRAGPLVEEIVDVPESTPQSSEISPSRPSWRWAKNAAGSIEITIAVPSLTHSLVSRTTLDVEPRRVLVSVPSHPPLDINLGVSDAEIAGTSGGSEAADAALKLKRERALDVEGATAEWRVGEGLLVLVV